VQKIYLLVGVPQGKPTVHCICARSIPVAYFSGTYRIKATYLNQLNQFSSYEKQVVRVSI